MLVWPIGGPEWEELWLRDDGMWMDADSDTPASDSLVEVTPGKGFHYKMGLPVTEGVATRYLVVKRPYSLE